MINPTFIDFVLFMIGLILGTGLGWWVATQREKLAEEQEAWEKSFEASLASRVHQWVRLAGVPPMHECSVCGKVTTKTGLAISAERCYGKESFEDRLARDV